MTEGYSADEVGAFASHFNRPVITPRPAAPLPEGVGYAEAINAGKSKHNEDQVSEGGFLAVADHIRRIEIKLSLTYIFPPSYCPH